VLSRLALTYKKMLHAAEQKRPDVSKAWRGWKRGQGGLDPAQLVFIDESAAKANMTRLRGRSPKGERLVCHAPHEHWGTTTIISSVRLDGTSACMTNRRGDQHRGLARGAGPHISPNRRLKRAGRHANYLV